jgi:type II secretory pathway component PulF
MHVMDAESTTSTDAPETHLARATWLLPAVLLHLLAWLMAWGYLYFLVPQQRAMFEDFGIAAPEAAMAVIRLSGFVGVYWPVIAVLVAVVVIGVDCVIVFLTRSRVARVTLLLLFLVPPIGWLVSCHLTMSQAIAPLVELLHEG